MMTLTAPPTARRLGSPRWEALGALMLLAGAALLLTACGGNGEPTLRDLDTANVPTGRATRDTFRVTLSETGILQARDQRPYLAPFSGRIVSIAEDGTVVKEGDTLVMLDTQKLRDDLESQINDLKISKADLEKTIEDLRVQLRSDTLDAESAEAALEYDRARLLEVNRQLETLEALAGLDVVASNEVDNKRSQFAGSRLNVIRSDLGYQSEDIGRDTNLDLRRQQLVDLGYKSEQSMSRIRDGQGRMESANIRAAQAGTWFVAKKWQGSDRRFIPTTAGTDVNQGDRLGELASDAQPLIISQISEAQVSFAKAGTSVTMTSAALNNVKFAGVVSSVGNAAIDREQSAVGAAAQLADPSGLKVFELRIDPVGEMPPEAKAGMTVDIAILKKEIPDAVSVPVGAIFREEGLPVVFVREAGGPRLVRVLLGDRTKERVVVLDGLKGDETVYLTDLNEALGELKARSGRKGSGAAPVN